MARLPRFVVPGHPQHVIQRGNNRGTIHGRPRYAKLSVDDFEQVKIAAIHPDFV